MKRFLPLLLLFLPLLSFSQEEILPRGFSDKELEMMKWYEFVTPRDLQRNLNDPPPVPVRHIAEWEELEALVITWRSYPQILREIVRHAKEEVKVIIVARNSVVKLQAENELQSNGISLDNVEFLVQDNNSVWVRDYGQNPVYANDVEDPYFIDWVYNRPRPDDDVVPYALGEMLDIPVYGTTEAPNRLVNTGGNFMSDGLGTAFSSTLVLDENDPGNPYGAGPHDEAAVDAIIQSFMGIDRYIKMNTLPYDGIHHIDMHFKLLDEETLLIGEYPEGVADGPQIEANLQYVLNNHLSAFGTPYKVKRILMPPDFGGNYPDQGGDYRTYTNSVFINKTILVPVYQEKYDTTALRIYRENFPGYKVVGINCNQMIGALGALHCITKEVAATDPLWIVHNRLEDIYDNDQPDDYIVDATIKHRTGIANANLYWTTDTFMGYAQVPMVQDGAHPDNWTADIPHQPNGSEIFYYIHAEANSGKQQVRPLVAPEGYYSFRVEGITTSSAEKKPTLLEAIYPNPATAITVIPVQSGKNTRVRIELVDVLGQVKAVIHQGNTPVGSSNYFLHADKYAPGTYFVRLVAGDTVVSQKLIIR